MHDFKDCQLAFRWNGEGTITEDPRAPKGKEGAGGENLSSRKLYILKRCIVLESTDAGSNRVCDQVYLHNVNYR